MNSRYLKMAVGYTIIVGYLVLLVFLVVVFASNVYAVVTITFAGPITFGIIVATLAMQIPLLKSQLSEVLRIANVIVEARIQTEWRIEGKINNFREKIETEVKGLLPYRMRLEWVVSDSDVVQYIDPKDPKKPVVVVRMKPQSEGDWNLASATLAYVSKGLLSDARIHMREALNRSIDFAFAKKLLEDEGETAARSYLMDQEVVPCLTKNEEIRSYYLQLMEIYEELLIRVFLREIGDASTRLAQQPAVNLSQDIIDFLNWSRRLATRAPGVEVPLWFSGRYFKVGCILVAESETYALHGSEPYVRRAQECVSQGANALYVLARGRNIEIAVSVAESIQHSITKVGLVRVEGSEKTYPVKLEAGISDAIAILFRPVMRKPAKANQT